MTTVEWEEPPPRSEHGAFVEALKQQPGRWARWPQVYASKAVCTNLHGRFGVETRTQQRENGRWDVWTRWPEDAVGTKQTLDKRTDDVIDDVVWHDAEIVHLEMLDNRTAYLGVYDQTRDRHWQVNIHAHSKHGLILTMTDEPERP